MRRRPVGDIIDPGQLDTPIELRGKSVVAYNVLKEPIYEDILLRVRSMMEYKGGSESVDLDRVTSHSTIIWTIRRVSIDTSYVVRYDGSDYDIEHIEKIGRGRYIRLHTKRIQG